MSNRISRRLVPHVLAFCAALGPAVCARAAPDAQAPRHLLVQVRDTAPAGAAGFYRGSDGGYTVSTGGGGARDDRASAPASDNATTLSTRASVRDVRVLEGERVRVDLPSVQSLQFHVPVTGHGATATGGAGTAAKGSAGAPPPASSPATGAGSAAGPAASAVVFFEAVSAFTARFWLAGSRVRVELVPLQAGGVAAPYLVGDPGSGGGRSGPLTVLGRVGEWIALGDTDLPAGGKSLTPTADAPTAPTVWVRVVPDPGALQQADPPSLGR